MASPKRVIDKELFEKLLLGGCTKLEIMKILQVGDKTLSRWIYDNYDGKKFTDISTVSPGRPVKEIDKALFEKLCRAQATEEEICDHLEVDKNTLIAWIKRNYEATNFSQLQHVYAMAGNAAVKIAQYDYALQNPEFSKWWGRQYLGQKEIVEQEIKATVNDTHSQVIDMLSNKVNLEELENQNEQSQDNQ